MKKIITITILLLMVVMIATTTVKAATTDTLADELYTIGSKYGMTSQDKVKIERYLADNPVTESEANQIVAKANEAAKIMEDLGATDVDQLTAEQKSQLQSIANEAASVIGLTLTFKSGTVEVYKDGKLIEVVGTDSSKLAYTGNNLNTVLAISTVAIIALVTVFVARKKFVNA